MKNRSFKQVLALALISALAIGLMVFDLNAEDSPTPIFKTEAVQTVYWDLTDPGSGINPWSKKNCYDGRDLILNDLNAMKANGDPKYKDFFDNYDYGPIKIEGTANVEELSDYNPFKGGGHVGVVIYPKGGKPSDGVVLEYTNYLSTTFGYYDTRTWDEWEYNWTGTVGGIDDKTKDEFKNYWKDPPEYPIPAGLEIAAKPKITTDSSRNTQVVNSCDPNEKTGSTGVGDSHYLPLQATVPYTVFFENDPDATADAQEVLIEDSIDIERLNPGSFSFGPVSFGSHVIIPPPLVAEFEELVDMRTGPDSKNILVKIRGIFNPATGDIQWKFTSIDPETWGLPELEGFLPPNISQPEGEGSVTYYISPRADQNLGLGGGTLIGQARKARIVFDDNEAILTGEWTNILDGEKPQSLVTGESPQYSATFPISWSGTDTASGIKDFTIYVSEGSEGYKPWLVNTTDTSGNFTGVPGTSYRFFSIARDKVDNLEEVPLNPDLTVSILSSVKISGSAYSNPEPSIYKASYSMDITGPYNPAGWLKYNYSRTRMNFNSTEITSLSVSGNVFTITGTGTVNRTSGYAFEARILDGSPDSFGIVIRKPDGTPYYVEDFHPVQGGSITTVSH